MKIGLLQELMQNFEREDDVYLGPKGIVIIRQSVSGCDVINLPSCPEIPTEPTMLDKLHDEIGHRNRGPA